jgi:hypothetical protein
MAMAASASTWLLLTSLTCLQVIDVICFVLGATAKNNELSMSE